MPGLRFQQIKQISRRLSQQIRHNEALQEEVLDHLCCQIEESLQEGLPFSQAMDRAFASFGSDGLKKLEQHVQQVTQLNHNLMKQLTFLSLVLILGLSFIMTNMLGQSLPEIAPLTTPIQVVSGFGMRVHPITKEKRHHFGIDLRAPMGTQVVATANGKVIKAYSIDQKPKSPYGNYIILEHDNDYQTLYSQLSEIQVEEGQEVSQGDVIGLSGSSGVSTGPHLHYEVIHQGKKVDPATFLKRG